ncbi:hypothetical protein CEXT_435021 [Caerostris extrusa]|uniref:Uncharacterized protein n=1 Tax=Caerostris extrusa TaxID=172846 RepID=A0AAV4RSY5_CAEEX|nr:hypothetical protein CEXT_435021 [Caerostris extrusa]
MVITGEESSELQIRSTEDGNSAAEGGRKKEKSKSSPHFVFSPLIFAFPVSCLHIMLAGVRGNDIMQTDIRPVLMDSVNRIEKFKRQARLLDLMGWNGEERCVRVCI